MTRIHVNGASHAIAHTPDATLLDVLRDTIGLRGPKAACGSGECGACTVLVDGTATFACIALASRIHGAVETIEGVADEAGALRAAFADTGAFQCGFCTPGQVVRALALMRSDAVPPDDHGLRHQLAGNICRCTGYQAIIDAIRAVAERADTAS
jgi:aerobic-type carbon monoxide dehydrogenase small subunit (CoxS/CutS family)